MVEPSDLYFMTSPSKYSSVLKNKFYTKKCQSRSYTAGSNHEKKDTTKTCSVPQSDRRTVFKWFLCLCFRTLTWLTSYGDRTSILVQEGKCSATATVRRTQRRRSPTYRTAKMSTMNRRAGEMGWTCRSLSQWTERLGRAFLSRFVKTIFPGR